MLIPITDLNDSRIQLFRERSEVQLMRCFEPEPGVFIAESPNVILRALQAGYEPISALLEKQDADGEAQAVLELIAQKGDIPIYTADKELLVPMIGYQLTRGVLCAMRRKTLSSYEVLCSSAKRIAILEDVMNPTNVGAIFRSAAALGVDCVLLSAGCSDPLYRRAARVSMGTVFQVPWTKMKKEEWPSAALQYLRGQGFKTVAMALREDTVSIADASLCGADKLAIVLGTEGEGLTEETINACDETVMIPMSHGVDSLNVAAASAVAFWQLCGCNLN